MSSESSARVPEVTVHTNAPVDSAPESIRRVIERRITTGELHPGDRIGLKSDLLKEFGVSAPTLDTALKLLANDGLVVLRRGPNGGVFVARSRPVLRLGSSQLWARDARTLGENIELREALAAYLGASAARVAERDPTQVTELRRLADVLDASEGAFETQRTIWSAYRILAEICDSVTLRSIYLDLLDAAEALILDIDFPESGPDAQREKTRITAHANLLRAVADGDVELARECGEIVRIVSPFGRDPSLSPRQT